MRIGIDMGHTLAGEDYGASGIREESELTREVGQKVIEKLQKLGHEVINCTCDNANSLVESLNYRVDKANYYNVDIFVCIHFNCFNSQAKGVEVFTYNGKEIQEARRILNNIEKLGFKNRCKDINGNDLSLKDGKGLYVIKNTDMPAMLIECCFCDNAEDMQRYNSEDLNNAIVKGLVGELPKEEIKPIEQPKVTYDTTRPTGNNIFSIGSHSYIEETTDGRTIIHNDRGNYISIGKGFVDLYWNDNNGNSGNKRIGGN